MEKDGLELECICLAGHLVTPKQNMHKTGNIYNLCDMH